MLDFYPHPARLSSFVIELLDKVKQPLLNASHKILGSETE
jgi:hypothetical protein